ncbi:MAG: hypothetical protein ACO3CN_05170, partial [Candidatus Nanopelagicales bacterium]
RQRTVLHLAQRYGVTLERAERVAGLALSLYSQSHGLLHHDDGSGYDGLRYHWYRAGLLLG